MAGKESDSMIPDFVLMPTAYQRLIQEGSPVHVQCSRCCTERRSGAAFIQVRLLNRSDRPIRSVYLRLEGLDAQGRCAFIMDEIVLADLDAAGHSIFGEDRIIALEQCCDCVHISIRRVVFADGNLWRCTAEPRLTAPEALDWDQCPCGCWNMPDAAQCTFCGRSLQRQIFNAAPEHKEVPEIPFAPRPAPILRQQPVFHPETEPRRLSGWAVFLICLGGVLTLSALALLAVF